MKDIKIGEYVRTRNGYIIKVDEKTVIFDMGYKEQYVDMETTIYGFTWEEEIVKHSKQLIDLIEPGDLVRIFVEENVDENGTTEDTCVYEVTTTQVKDFYGNKLEEIGIVGEDGTELIPFANVRRIVTKEQFASKEYKVKE